MLVRALRILAAALVLTAGAGALASATESWVTASGVATNTDQDAAYKQAAYNAVASLNDKCGALLTNVAQTNLKTEQTKDDPPAWKITVSIHGLCHYDQDN